MSWLAGPYAVACVLLVLAGAQKLVRPDPTGLALRAAHLPSSRIAVRALAAVELAAAGAGLAGLRVGAVAVATLYLAFTAFVVAALAAGTPLRSCGCFAATDDVPPTRVHVFADIVLAATALAVALRGVDLPSVVRHQPAAAVPFGAMAAAATYVTYVALAVLPLVDPRAVSRAWSPR